MPAVQPGPTSIIQIIDRLTRSPDVDVEKIQRLLDMHERIIARDAAAAYADALAQMQAELPIIEERGSILNKQGEVQSTYPLWEDINEAIKPILSRYGFGLSFRTGNVTSTGGERVISVTAILSHREGHFEGTPIEFPADTTGNKNVVQSLVSSISYGKRCTASALLNLVSRGEDDDGVAAGIKTITEEEAATIEKEIRTVGANREHFLTYFEVNDVARIPAGEFDRVMELLDQKRQRKLQRERAAQEAA